MVFYIELSISSYAFAGKVVLGKCCLRVTFNPFVPECIGSRGGLFV